MIVCYQTAPPSPCPSSTSRRPAPRGAGAAGGWVGDRAGGRVWTGGGGGPGPSPSPLFPPPLPSLRADSTSGGEAGCVPTRLPGRLEASRCCLAAGGYPTPPLRTRPTGVERERCPSPLPPPSPIFRFLSPSRRRAPRRQGFFWWKAHRGEGGVGGVCATERAAGGSGCMHGRPRLKLPRVPCSPSFHPYIHPCGGGDEWMDGGEGRGGPCQARPASLEERVPGLAFASLPATSDGHHRPPDGLSFPPSRFSSFLSGAYPTVFPTRFETPPKAKREYPTPARTPRCRSFSPPAAPEPGAGGGGEDWVG